jgi:hypothetical protein
VNSDVAAFPSFHHTLITQLTQRTRSHELLAWMHHYFMSPSA